MIQLFTLTLLIFLGVVWILLSVKTPHYQMQRADVIRLLQAVVVGQASENDWAIFLSSSFRHAPGLEQVRERCAQIDEQSYLAHAPNGFLFTQLGLDQIKALLADLESEPNH